MQGLPPSAPWLAGAKAGFGVDERNPIVARILQILHQIRQLFLQVLLQILLNYLQVPLLLASGYV